MARIPNYQVINQNSSLKTKIGTNFGKLFNQQIPSSTLQNLTPLYPSSWPSNHQPLPTCLWLAHQGLLSKKIKSNSVLRTLCSHLGSHVKNQNSMSDISRSQPELKWKNLRGRKSWKSRHPINCQLTISIKVWQAVFLALPRVKSEAIRISGLSMSNLKLSKHRLWTNLRWESTQSHQPKTSVISWSIRLIYLRMVNQRNRPRSSELNKNLPRLN